MTEKKQLSEIALRYLRGDKQAVIDMDRVNAAERKYIRTLIEQYKQIHFVGRYGTQPRPPRPKTQQINMIIFDDIVPPAE